MKRNIRASILIGLIAAAICFLITGCAKEKDSSAINHLVPDEGYYSNDYEEILKIEKSDDGSYSIEYSIFKLLYIENAVGTYDSGTGILSFSGKDGTGNILEADIENKGDHLEVTVTQSSHKDINGSVQDFYKTDEP